MDLYSKIIETYPELKITPELDNFSNGTIKLQNDSDELGDYIKEWNYSKPIPAGLSVGKPK
jgi:hypothetical protein